MLVVPHPGLGIDGLANRAQNTQRAQVGPGRVHFLVRLGRLDQGANGRGRGVEDAALVAFDRLPEAPCVGVGRHALKNDLGRTGRQRTVGYVGVSGDPANVGGTPKHIVAAQVKRPVHGEFGPQHKAAGCVLHALGFAGGTRGVQDEQGVLSANGHRCALSALAGQRLRKSLIPPGHHIAGRGRSFVDEDVFDGFTAAQAQALVHNRFER